MYTTGPQWQNGTYTDTMYLEKYVKSLEFLM